jgi:hypothetical protein
MMKPFFHFSLCTMGMIGLAPGVITFNVNFTQAAQGAFTPAQQAQFTAGLNFWDSVIDGHQDGVSRNWTLEVDVFDTPPSGGGIVLGSGGPGSLILSDPVPGSGLGGGFTDRFILSSSGDADFNINPAALPLSDAVIRHEIGHALGIGTLWEDNELYNDGVSGNSNRTLPGGFLGQYVGSEALAIYRAEFDPSATFIPIELDGGMGTAHGHWNEVTDNFRSENQPGFDSDPGDGGPAPTVLFGPNLGESLDDELMSGVLTGSTYLSETTKASLIDLGFTLESPPIPEPSVLSLVLLSGSLFLRRRGDAARR